MHSGSLNPDVVSADLANNQSLSAILRKRFEALKDASADFIDYLNSNVERLNAFFVSEVSDLHTRKEKTSNEQSEEIVRARTVELLLRDVVRLERYIFLNFTGICKILKKHDKWSGIKLSEIFLTGISHLDFYKSLGLLELKQKLMDNITGSDAQVITSPRWNSTPLGNSQDSLDSAFNLGSASLIAPSSTAMLPNHPNQWFPPAMILPSQKIIISISGPHGTDIIGALVENLSKHSVDIEDLTFSRLLHNVTCSALVHLSSENVNLFHDLTNSSRKWEAELTYYVYDEVERLPKRLQDAPYENRQKYTATILNQTGLTSKFLNLWTKLLLKYQISAESMRRLNEGRICVMEMRLSVPNDVEFDRFRQEVFQLSSENGTDVALQSDNVYRWNKRLVIMDMDSTLIQQEVIDELARRVGVVSQVAAITHRAMNGEIDFKESLKQRVNLLTGAPVQILEDVRKSLVFTEGAHFLCRALKKLGYKLAVISGGFIPLASYVKNELGLDYAFANQLKVSADGHTLMGETVGPVVDAERKAELLEVIAQAEGVGPEQVVAIGDGANDLLMLAAAGLGVAFNAKPKVQEKARARINQKSLRNVLYLLGYADEDIKELA